MDRAVDIFGHFGLPIDLDPDAQPVGYDDAGFPVFQGKTGQTYTTNMQGNALSGGMMDSIKAGVAAPGNALRGKPVTLGNVWNTAGLAQMGTRQ